MPKAPKGKAAKKNALPPSVGEVDLAKYEKFDQEWRQIGLAGPARRALVDAKLYKVSDLRKISLKDLEELHGMGKSAIARIKVIMDAKKIKFQP
jgi:hypothetical protein